jgi:transcription-repair coupling factor (superfamily II helicase)
LEAKKRRQLRQLQDRLAKRKDARREGTALFFRGEFRQIKKMTIELEKAGLTSQEANTIANSELDEEETEEVMNQFFYQHRLIAVSPYHNFQLIATLFCIMLLLL